MLRGIGMTSQRTRDRLVRRLRDEGIENVQVLEVIRNTPRHIFVDEALASRAYEDTALPIGFGQTISQPYMVALMSAELLAAGPIGKVLEIGTGSGYQTAVLAQLATQVFTVERVAALSTSARARLRTLGLGNVRFRHSDGTLGWAQHAPYDAILAAAASVEIPHELLAQLADGGRLVAPVGERHAQRLVRITRSGDSFVQETVERARF
ncbi:MAG: protein-L-isoaspartate(D-aspartate) O-methyltransferase, partial [Pseudomonadota bacterium]